MAQVTIDAELRPRTELRSGFNQPLANSLKAGFLTLQRTRLRLNYTTDELKTRITLQDSRIFGETSTSQQATVGSLGIYEAWTELLIISGVSFKIGRQEIHFEDGRLFSRSPWSNTGNSHDLMQFIYRSNYMSGECGFAYNNQKAYNADSSYYNISKTYKQLIFMHLSRKLKSGLTMSILGVDEGTQTSKTNFNLYHRITAGGTLSYQKEKVPFTSFFTVYFQTGKSNASVDLNAYLLALKTTYSYSPKIEITAGFDYLSGSENTLETNKTNTFNKLSYGVNHSFYGFMEYWSTLPKGGLVKYAFGPRFRLSKQFSSNITWYGFNLAKSMKIASSDVRGSIGSELDVVFNYQVSAISTIQFSWCGYFDNSNTNLLKFNKTDVATKFPQFAYVMFTINPELYKSN